MRLIVIFLLLSSCLQIPNEKQTKEEIPEPEEYFPLIINHNHELENNIDSEPIDTVFYPFWLKKIYEDSLKLIENPNGYYDTIVEIQEFVQLNDSISYCVFNNGNGNCGFSFLASQKFKKPYYTFEIALNCDADQGYFESIYSDFKKIDSVRFFKTTIREYVPDSLVDENGWIKFGKTIEDCPLLNDTIYHEYSVLNNGKILERKIK